MDRNPDQHRKLNYYKNIHYRKFKPIFSWFQCQQCKREFRRETIYELSEPSVIGFTWHYHTYGCTHCFPDINDFKTWCKENVLLKPEDFATDDNIQKFRKLLF